MKKVIILGLSFCFVNSMFSFKERDVQFCKDIIEAINDNDPQKIERLWGENHISLNQTQISYIKQLAIENLATKKNAIESLFKSYKDSGNIILGLFLGTFGGFINFIAIKQKTVGLMDNKHYNFQNYLGGALGLGLIGLGYKLARNGWKMTAAEHRLKKAQLIYDILVKS